jgi:hypothetical protein
MTRIRKVSDLERVLALKLGDTTALLESQPGGRGAEKPTNPARRERAALEEFRLDCFL